MVWAQWRIFKTATRVLPSGGLVTPPTAILRKALAFFENVYESNLRVKA